jgi:5'-3' exonuclease
LYTVFNMGIPSYFNHILINHRDIIVKKQHVSCDYFFLDANSLIYDVIHQMKHHIVNHKQVFDGVKDRVDTLINIMQPSEKVFLSFDGTPPIPKMHQQRQRRFKSQLIKQIHCEIQQIEPRGSPSNTNSKSSWNTNQITPGTDFMNALQHYFEQVYQNDPKVIFSGPNEPGEGEHKICHYIRKNHAIMTDKTKVIYGLDADLIMLGLILSCDHKHIYLYKETHHFEYISRIDPKVDYLFHINKLAFQISNILVNAHVVQAVCDYILMCFLCGNDFLPHLPSINIRNQGIQYLISSYKCMRAEYRQQGKSNGRKQVFHLIDIESKPRRIIWKNLSIFVGKLMVNESEKIEENITWKMKLRHRVKELQTNEDKLNVLPCFDTEREEYLLENMDKYNSMVLGTENVNDVCSDYLKMLEWAWYYYNGFLINNDTIYSHTMGPKFKDLHQHIPIFSNEQINTNVDLNPNEEYQKVCMGSISPISQLYYVLPPQDHDTLIPKEPMQKTKQSLYHVFPTLKQGNMSIDYTFCKYFWEGHMVLDGMDIHSLNKVVKSCLC